MVCLVLTFLIFVIIISSIIDESTKLKIDDRNRMVNNGQNLVKAAYELDTVQDFLIELDMNHVWHLVEISIFSLNNVTVRPTKIMNRADKNWAHFSMS